MDKVIGIVKKQNEVLIGKVKDERLADFGGIKYVFPGGSVEDGETLEQAVIREIKEETGLDAGIIDNVGSRTHPITGKVIHYFVCEALSDELDTSHSSNDDLSELIWADAKHLKDFMPTIFDKVQFYITADTNLASYSSSIKLDMEKLITILKVRYGFDDLKLESIARRTAGLQDTFIVHTPIELFFLKSFDKPQDVVLRSTKLNHLLNELDYPAVKIIPDQDENLVNKVQDKYYAIYEYIDIKESENISLSEVLDFGRQLGVLHSLTKDIECKFNSEETFNDFYELAGESNKYKNKLSNIQKEVLVKLEKNLEKIASELPKMQKLLSHGEYTIQHTRFRDNKVHKVIDWDGIGLEYPILDLGMAATFCIKKDTIDFEMLIKFFQGYFEKNDLSEVERALIYEGILYGASKFILWSLSEPEINESAFELFNIVTRNKQNIKAILNKLVG